MGGVHVSNTRRRVALSDDDDEVGSARAVSNATKHAESRAIFSCAADAVSEEEEEDEVPTGEAAATAATASAEFCTVRVDDSVRALESAPLSRNAAGIDRSAVNEVPTADRSVGAAAVSFNALPFGKSSEEDDEWASSRVCWSSTRPSSCKSSTSNTQYRLDWLFSKEQKAETEGK
jgi:hypothetical protein